MSNIDYKQEITKLRSLLNDEIAKFETKMNDVIKDEMTYCKHLKTRLNFVKWINKKFDLLFEPMPKQVYQREIFYCNLGFNIGSEQGDRRPVVVLQNNIGNQFGNTTIIAPITTYENSTFTKENGVWYIEYMENNVNIKRKLDFYEIPVEVEKGSKYNITGIVNIVHMREVSKKRLSNLPVAKITADNFREIHKAASKNIDII